MPALSKDAASLPQGIGYGLPSHSRPMNDRQSEQCHEETSRFPETPESPRRGEPLSQGGRARQEAQGAAPGRAHAVERVASGRLAAGLLAGKCHRPTTRVISDKEGVRSKRALIRSG